MPLSLIIPATATVQFMPLKVTELKWHDDLPLGGGGRFVHNSPTSYISEKEQYGQPCPVV
jgi:hypothetical protein